MATAPTCWNWLTIKEASQCVGVGEQTIRRWIDKGILRAHRQGRVIRIAPDDLKSAFTATDSWKDITTHA